MARELLSREVLRKVRQIEIYTKRLLRGMLLGDARSKIRGAGFDFDQIRDYQAGDDVRFIDWHASARSSTLLVKQYIQERSRTVMLLVDTSASVFFGADEEKYATIAQMAGAVAIAAQHGNDAVGLLLFSNVQERYIPPARGMSHVRRVLEALFSIKPSSSKTNLSVPLHLLGKIKRKDTMAFLFSDFIDSTFNERDLALARSYECVAVRLLDTQEREFPEVGFVTVRDVESGGELFLDMRRAGARQLTAYLQARQEKQCRLLKKHRIDFLDISNRATSIADMIAFFRQRMH